MKEVIMLKSYKFNDALYNHDVTLKQLHIMCLLINGAVNAIMEDVRNKKCTIGDVHNAMIYMEVDFCTYRRISEMLYVEVMNHDK